MWHELRKRIGDDAFWKIVRRWPDRDPDNATRTATSTSTGWSQQTHVDRTVLRGLAAQPDHAASAPDAEPSFCCALIATVRKVVPRRPSG